MNNSKKKLLIVDDDELLREMLVMAFEDENYQITAAVDGREAWGLMNTSHHDLLLTDMFMPQMNGIDLILKCQEQFPVIKTILLSGGGKGIKAEHGKRHIKFQDQAVQIDMFLQKPCDYDDMISVVERLLRE